MSIKALQPWSPTPPVAIPPNVKEAAEIVPYAKQLSEREIKQIVSAFQSENYEMASAFTWQKAMAGLKKVISSLGMEFVGELLGRTDISRSSQASSKLTDHDALFLAEELGIVGPTVAKRLRVAMNVVHHFSEYNEQQDDEAKMTHAEAVSVLYASTQAILGQPNLDTALRFAEFRQGLESKTLKDGDQDVKNLAESPYFFKRTTLGVLLALSKFATGAQLQNGLANMEVILPHIWPALQKPDRYQAGMAYAQLHAGGRSSAVAALKRALLKVKGFDYVPENLRAQTFIDAAALITAAHYDFDNFHHEKEPMIKLGALGTAIPWPAVPRVMKAALCVCLGNYWGHSFAAKPVADEYLSRVPSQIWVYFLSECLPIDRDILSKLDESSPARNWCKLVAELKLQELQLTNQAVNELVVASSKNEIDRVGRLAAKLLKQISEQ